MGEGTGTGTAWTEASALPQPEEKVSFFPGYILEGGLAEAPLLDPLRQSAGYSWHHLKTLEPNRQNGELLIGEMGPN